MEILVSTYTAVTVGALAFVLVALLLAQLITTAERQLIASAAILLAGVFFVARPESAAALMIVGVSCWAAGLTLFAWQALHWKSAHASKAGPLAVVFLLPPALVGAVLGVGVLLSALVAPARLALRILGA